MSSRRSDQRKTTATTCDDGVGCSEPQALTLTDLVNELRDLLTRTDCNLATALDHIEGPGPACVGESKACEPTGLVACLQSCLAMARCVADRSAQVRDRLA